MSSSRSLFKCHTWQGEGKERWRGNEGEDSKESKKGKPSKESKVGKDSHKSKEESKGEKQEAEARQESDTKVRIITRCEVRCMTEEQQRANDDMMLILVNWSGRSCGNFAGLNNLHGSGCPEEHIRASKLPKRRRVKGKLRCERAGPTCHVCAPLVQLVEHHCILEGTATAKNNFRSCRDRDVERTLPSFADLPRREWAHGKLTETQR